MRTILLSRIYSCITILILSWGLTISANLPLVEVTPFDGLVLKIGGFILADYPAQAFAFEGRFTFLDFPEVKMTFAYMFEDEEGKLKKSEKSVIRN